MENIIFKYQTSAMFVCPIDDTEVGFEVIIVADDKNNLQYTSSAFNHRVIHNDCFTISKGSIEKIKKIIENSEIFEIEQNLYNGSLDGNWNTFYFSDGQKETEISASNINRSADCDDFFSQEKIDALDKYSRNIIKSIIQERKVLVVFDQISSILCSEGYVLDLYSFKPVI